MVGYRPRLWALLADEQWHGMNEIARAIRPAVRPEILYRQGVRLAKVKPDRDSISYREMERYMAIGLRYLINTALNQFHIENIESRGYRETREFRWVRRLDKRCGVCDTHIEDYPGATRLYCVPCGKRIANPPTLPQHVCPGCGVEYRPKQHTQKYCSRPCVRRHIPNYGRRGKPQ